MNTKNRKNGNSIKHDWLSYQLRHCMLLGNKDLGWYVTSC